MAMAAVHRVRLRPLVRYHLGITDDGVSAPVDGAAIAIAIAA
jgi:hypothetical protein